MLLTFEEFKQAKETVNRIIKDTNVEDVDDELENIAKQIDEEKRREFLNHLNGLFLDVLLNRLDELGESARDKSMAARRKITELINR